LASTVKIKPPATRRNKQYEKRLDSILKAASKVIARDGFEGASIRKVAATAGIGLSGIYYYFESKDELLFALQSRTFSTLVSSLEKFQFFATNMYDLKVCVHEIGSLSGDYYKQILTTRRKYYKLVKEVVTENIKSADRQDINLSTLFLFGSLNWVYMWYDPKKNSNIGKLSNQLLKIYLNGIKVS